MVKATTDPDALAIFGGAPVRPEPIKVTVRFSPELKQEIMSFLDRADALGVYYGGPQTRRFEEAFAAAHGGDRFAVATNSGTSALHVALAAAGVGPGDEVIVQAFSFISDASTIIQLGAVPVMCDVEPVSLTMDVAQAESLITERTKAILPVHYWGYPANLPALRELCDRHGLVLIEDSAQAPLAPVGSRTTGVFGDFATYSFCDRKHIRCGEGGLVLCRSEKDAARVRSLVNVGKSEEWDGYIELGYSYRMLELSAMICLEGLRHLPAEQAARRAAAARYAETLAGTDLTPVPDVPWGESIYFKLPILLPDEHLDARPFITDALVAEHVSCRIPHRPLYDVPWVADYLRERGAYRGAADCPVTADAFRRMIEVETGPYLPAEEAAASARAVAKVWRAVLSGAAHA